MYTLYSIITFNIFNQSVVYVGENSRTPLQHAYLYYVLYMLV